MIAIALCFLLYIQLVLVGCGNIIFPKETAKSQSQNVQEFNECKGVADEEGVSTPTIVVSSQNQRTIYR